MNTYTLIKKQDGNFILCNDEPIDMKRPLQVTGEEKISWEHPQVPYHIKEDDYPYEILASLHKTEGVPTLTFDEVLAREIGYVDMLKKCNEIYDMHPINIEVYGDSESKNTYQAGVWDGYLQAIEDNKERRYTEAELRIAIDMARGFTFDQHWNKYENHKTDEIISSLHKTSWKVEIEMGEYRLNDDGEAIGFPDMTKPKVTNNTIHILKIIL